MWDPQPLLKTDTAEERDRNSIGKINQIIKKGKRESESLPAAMLNEPKVI